MYKCASPQSHLSTHFTQVYGLQLNRIELLTYEGCHYCEETPVHTIFPPQWIYKKEKKFRLKQNDIQMKFNSNRSWTYGQREAGAGRVWCSLINSATWDRCNFWCSSYQDPKLKCLLGDPTYRIQSAPFKEYAPPTLPILCLYLNAHVLWDSLLDNYVLSLPPFTCVITAPYGKNCVWEQWSGFPVFCQNGVFKPLLQHWVCKNEIERIANILLYIQPDTLQ